MTRAAGSFDCHDIVSDKLRFDRKPLGGPHVVHDIIEEDLIVHNKTYTIDLCQPLKPTKGVPSEKQCPHGTWGESYA
jgi:autophagy-related protein 27